MGLLEREPSLARLAIWAPEAPLLDLCNRGADREELFRALLINTDASV